MKKTLIALCGALSLAAFAEPETPAQDAPEAPRAPRMERGNRGPRQFPQPTMLVLTEKTTPEEIAQYKDAVLKKIDEAVAKYAEKDEAAKKRPVRLAFFSNEGFGPGMGPRGEGRGPRGEGRRGRGERPQRPEGEQRPEGAEGNPPPAPPADAPDAPEAK